MTEVLAGVKTDEVIVVKGFLGLSQGKKVETSKAQ